MLDQKDLIKKVKDYNKFLNPETLSKAYTFAVEAHKNQKRDAGEPYIIHPVAVAAILTDLKLDSATITTGLLHDTIEDTKATYKTVEKEFGKEVAEKNKALKNFLHKNMYSHRKVLRMEFKAELTLEGIFKAYTKMPGLLPDWVQKNEGLLELRICDYVSGMTDRYAINEHKNLYSADEEN